MISYTADYLFKKDRVGFLQSANNPRFSERELHCPVYEGAYVLSQEGDKVCGVCTADLQYIHTSYVDGYGYRDFDGSNPINEHCDAVFIGSFTRPWGHLFTDHFKRLWFLQTEQCRELLGRGAKVVYTTVQNEPLSDIAIAFFNLLGVDVSQFVHVTQTTRFDRVYLPDPSIFLRVNDQIPYGDRYYTKEYLELIDSIRKREFSSPIPSADKVYFTRTGIRNNSWREMGEESLERYFKDRGYLIVSPEKYSIEEQIGILSHCKSFATTEGSIAHSAIFCNKDTEVVICRKAPYINTYQLIANEIAQVKATFIDTYYPCRPYDRTFPWYGPFFLIRTRHLRSYFCRSRVESIFCRLAFPVFLRISFWRFIVRTRRITHK